jgi:ribosomal protein L11 methyltransferase
VVVAASARIARVLNVRSARIRKAVTPTKETLNNSTFSKPHTGCLQGSLFYTMNYIQLSIEATALDQELLIGQLSELAPTGFEQTDTYLLAYFEEERFPSYDVHEVLKKFTFQITTVAEQNWNADWEASFEPVVVADFCAVRAHFHPTVPGVQHEIIITPKMSFGTGHHATTYMMLEQMQGLDFYSKTVLDFGTGTGVLAILAEKLGASHVTAIDNDAWSFENAQENIQLNHCEKITTLLTDTIPQTEHFDIILANITKNVLLSYMGILKSCLKPSAYLLLSGLLQDDKDEMAAAAHDMGIKLVTERIRAGWLSLLFEN